MIQNNTSFKILRAHPGNDRWEIVRDGQTVAHSATYNGAVKAAQEIERSEAEAKVSARTFRETLRVGHLARVLAARLGIEARR